MEIDDEEIKAVEKILKEPVAAEFSEQAWRIRANLIVTSAIGFVMAVADLRINPDSSFLGLKVFGLSDLVIRATLAAVLIYLLFHFIWVAWDAFLEWRLRVTGTRSAFQTGSFFSDKNADYPVDPRQSTLYNWWSMQHSAIGNLGKLAGELKSTCASWEADLKAIQANSPSDPQSLNLNNAIRGLAQANEQAATIARKVEANTNAITSPRIPTSLKRFDGWFQLFLRSQNLRWLVVEFVAPVAFAAYTLWILLQRA